MVCVPNEGHTGPEAYDNRLLFSVHLGMLQAMSHFGLREYQGVRYDYPEGTEYEFSWASVGRLLTPLARERLTEWAVKAEVDYMLHVDDDMIIPTNLFERLIRHNVDIVAPLAFMRIPPHKPVIFRLEEGWDAMRRMEYFVSYTVDNYPKDTLVECDAVGFGACLIKMDVVRRMPKPWFMSTTSAGEDVWFCLQARKYGARVYMDTSTKLGHVGIPPIIEEKDYERESQVAELRRTHGDWVNSRPKESVKA